MIKPLHQQGFSLIECALGLAILTVISLPLMRLMQTQQATQQQQNLLNQKQQITSHLEGFVLTHQRLVCPASTPNGDEARTDQQCDQPTGWLPTRTLGLPLIEPAWQLSIATLASAGSPAAHSLERDQPLAQINLQTLSSIIDNPITATRPLGSGPLPAIHMCLAQTDQPTPSPTTYGCGSLPTQSWSAVAVIYPRNQPLREQQFLLHPNDPQNNPIWLSYERLVWLWMQSGSLSQP